MTSSAPTWTCSLAPICPFASHSHFPRHSRVCPGRPSDVLLCSQDAVACQTGGQADVLFDSITASVPPSLHPDVISSPDVLRRFPFPSLPTRVLIASAIPIVRTDVSLLSRR